MDVFGFDSLKSSHPVSVTIGNPSQISSIFDRISYEKGSSVIRMMHLFLGDEVFFGGVGSYLQKYKYNNAEQDNLWESLTEEAHKHEALDQSLNLKTIMDTWTLQTGYPIITVTRNYENNTATIVQRRFLSDPSSNKLTDSENPCWWVPLSYTTAQIADFNTTEPKAWLECDANGVAVTKELIDLPEDDEWILFNVQISGLYKVKYDERNWNSLIEQLTGTEYDKIATLNRAELINDALDLAWSGDQDYAVALKLIKYLKQEKEYLPWRAALSTLSDVNRMLKRSPQYGLFKVSKSEKSWPFAMFSHRSSSHRNTFSASFCQFTNDWAVWMPSANQAIRWISSSTKYSFRHGRVALMSATVKRSQRYFSRNGPNRKIQRNSIQCPLICVESSTAQPSVRAVIANGNSCGRATVRVTLPLNVKWFWVHWDVHAKFGCCNVISTGHWTNRRACENKIVASCSTMLHPMTLVSYWPNHSCTTESIPSTKSKNLINSMPSQFESSLLICHSLFQIVAGQRQ